ncbi:MAG: hypothetical protein FJ387_22215 [Verrucomicrobia bacterium]|nr:hypothetical protein [Verrucomicrobiota bacterium]
MLSQPPRLTQDHFRFRSCSRGARELLTLRGYQASIECLQFSSGGNILASSSADGIVRLWRAEPEARGKLHGTIGRSGNESGVVRRPEAIGVTSLCGQRSSPKTL